MAGQSDDVMNETETKLNQQTRSAASLRGYSEHGWTKLADGVAFALRVHATQVRKGADTPYASHLFGVASLVLEHGDDEEQAVAAMLHDAVEDVGAHLEPVIRTRFGDRVADIVLGWTDADTLPKPPWRARKKTYINHLE